MTEVVFWGDDPFESINDNIDFEKVNGTLPKLSYANGKKFKVTVGKLKKMI